MYAMERLLFLFLQLELKYTLHLFQLVMESWLGNLWHFAQDDLLCSIIWWTPQQQGASLRAKAGSHTPFELQNIVFAATCKIKGKDIPTTNDGEPELFHIVSGEWIEQHCRLGDKEVRKITTVWTYQLLQSWFCCWWYFCTFSEHVFETKQVVALVKSWKKNSGTVASIIAHESLGVSVLGMIAAQLTMWFRNLQTSGVFLGGPCLRSYLHCWLVQVAMLSTSGMAELIRRMTMMQVSSKIWHQNGTDTNIWSLKKHQSLTYDCRCIISIMMMRMMMILRMRTGRTCRLVHLWSASKTLSENPEVALLMTLQNFLERFIPMDELLHGQLCGSWSNCWRLVFFKIDVT